MSLTGADSATATFVLSGDGAASIVNSRGTQNVTVRKVVETIQTTDTFPFIATIMNGETPATNYTAYIDTENSGNNLTTNSDGQLTFTLGQDESRTMTIPYGSKLVVAETMMINYEPSAAMVDSNDKPIEDGDTMAASFTVNSVTTDGTITFTNTPVTTMNVIFDVNGGDWTPVTSPSFEHLAGDLYAITSDHISDNAYRPADPTQTGKVFIGWTLNEEIASHTDFSSEQPVTWGSETITPDSGGIVLDKIRSDYLWDFTQAPPYGQTLYAVWSDAVTVTFDIVRTGSNLHTWTGPATTDAQAPHVYYRSSSTSGSITYTMAKGERVPKPGDPTTDQSGWNFVNWLLNDTSRRNSPKNPNDSTIVNKTYEFSQRVTSNITLSTSWTTTIPQVFTFTVTNNVINGDPVDEFTYTIAVSNEQVYGKIGPTNQGNKLGPPDRTWGSVTTTLKNNETYTIQIKVQRSTVYTPNVYSVEIDVIDRDGSTIKSGHVIYCNHNANKNFVSDYEYMLTITQNAKTGYETTVGVEDRNNVDPPVYYAENPPANFEEASDSERKFTFTSIHCGTSSQANNFTPLTNEYTENESNGLTVVFTNRMPICKIVTMENGEPVEHPFYSLNEATTYITNASSGTVYATPGSSGYSAGTNPVIEMLVDYTMPSTDTVTTPAGSNVTLTTASKTYGGAYPFRGTGTTAAITRGFDDSSLFTVGAGASLTFSNITLDGDKSNHTSSAQGGLVNAAAANASVTMSSGVTLTNSKTTSDGGAVYVGSGSTFTMNGGTISNCEAENGAAIYADQGTLNIGGTAQISTNTASGTIGGAINTSASGATINFSGEPVISDNPASGSGQKNVVLSENSNTIINVTGTLGSNADIGIYDASGNGDTEGGHNRAGEPFGTRVTGVTGDFSKFVNDRNGLYGMQSGDDPDMLVIWEAVTLSVSKTVTGGTGEQTQDFTFTLTVASDDTTPTSYIILKTKQGGTTENLAISSGETFTLKDSETASIKWLPKDVNISVAETALDDCTTTSNLTIGNGSAVEENGVSRTFTLSDNGILDFVNTLQGQETPVAPTGFTSRHTPWLLLLLFGLILLIGGIGFVRRRERGDDHDNGGMAACIPTNTGPPGGITLANSPPAAIDNPIEPEKVNTSQPEAQPTNPATDAESYIRWRNSVWVENNSFGPQRGYITPQTKATPCPRANLWGGDAG